MDTSAIIDFVGFAAYQKGRAYYNQGRAKILSVRNGVVKGSVRGSRAKPYRVELTADDDKVLDVFCSCPVGESCKHIAALWLALLAARGGNKTPPASPVAARPQSRTGAPRSGWLRTLEQTIANTGSAEVRRGVEILMRIVREPPDSGVSYGKSLPRVQLRPRVRDGATQQVSLTALQWSDCRSAGSYPLNGVITPRATQFVTQLASALHLSYRPVASWMGVPDANAAAVWHLLRHHGEFGVALFFEEGNDALPAVVGEMPFVIRYVLRDEGEGLALETEARLDNNIPTPGSMFLVGNPPAFGLLTGQSDAAVGVTLHGVTEGTDIEVMEKPLVIPHADMPVFLAQFVPRLLQHATIENRTAHVMLPERVEPKAHISVARAPMHGIAVRFGWRYGDTDIPLSYSDPVVTMPRGKTAVRIMAAEATLGTHIGAALPTLAVAADFPEELTLHEMDAARFLNDILPEVARHPSVVISKSPDLPVFRPVESPPVVTCSVRQNADAHDWFNLEMIIAVDGAPVPFREVFAALVAGKRHLFLEDGRYILLDTPEFKRLSGLIARAQHLVDPERDSLRLSRYHAGWWDELQRLGVVAHQDREWRDAMRLLKSAQDLRLYDPPKGCRAELRPYQRQGYSWLRFLHARGLGGILADDMGLGKTVQSIALIVAVKERGRKKAGLPFLIIAPTSVVENWDMEFERFAPHLARVVLRRGRRDDLHRAMSGADVVIASYALLHRDYDELKAISWDTIIVDEAQFAKNYQSKVYTLLRGLTARSRLALTGTPLENNLMELWSLFSIVCPGLFSSPERFREHYQRPIEKESSVEALRLLRTQMRPFLLRRDKTMVERDLPQKTEQVRLLDMEPRQRHIYDLHLQRARARVLKLLNEGGFKDHRFEILTALTRLRQLCLHPALVDASHHHVASAKISALLEEVDAIVAGGHKALVFSQFTSFLGLIREQFDRRRIAYHYLDGRTRNRRAVTQRFQEDGQTRIFLMSLKAGGVGLNLTAADYCILLDPWWNPAVEAQAVDRTHRIGQTKPVFISRFIIKDSIEEKVLGLQEKKKKLFDNVLNEGAAFGTLITEEDIRQVLG